MRFCALCAPVQMLSKMLPNHLELHPPNQESQV